ncbi:MULTISPECIES: hypothetical protein [Paenibacillus]|uniref:Uncharacterized protein n=2 Tax=Paenibacillus lactis TaxID=228574 RepID=G4HGB6_9BACL|nr:hypothetical protein [Paenibacillus lactis]EHB63789.1 hypothetical protein PaelaDRAFT_2903 [Paenibacillus lactis 154]MBP1893588.1 hypothetical protein [Paenibacillus lactis]GIO92183.1 hypothetical protein J31TS3_34100 [Paenibacillus lactis]
MKERMLAYRRKKHSKIIIIVAVFIIFLSIVLLIINSNAKKRIEVTSSYYASFVSSVQTLDKMLAQTSGAKADEIAIKMLDVYTTVIFVNDRLDLLEDNAHSFLGLEVLKNDFSAFKYTFASIVRSCIEDRDGLESEIHLKVAKHIHLFSINLPRNYENSNDFYNQFRIAAEHIKPLPNIPFEK